MNSLSINVISVFTLTQLEMHVSLFVEGVLILRTNIEVTKSTICMLSDNFEMKDMGVADVILEIKITRTPDGISLSQSH